MGKPQPVDFGVTPWGRDWVKRVEPLRVTKPNPLLPKARGLVRGGHAVVELLAGQITVMVAVASKSHCVTVRARQYSAAERRKVLKHLETAGIRSTASGDLPDDLYEVLRRESLEPLPDSTTLECACTSKVSPCLHATAAAYAVGVYVDRTPLTALTFRGVTPQTYATSTSVELPPRWMNVSDVDPIGFFLSPSNR